MGDETQEKFRSLAARYEVSIKAVEVLAQALKTSGGRQAQFNHPELGGMGQWQPGMTMIGDMFNAALKARVDGLATELSTLTISLPKIEFEPMSGFTADWWDSSLGTPNATGGQNETAYAYFANHHRLLIKDRGHITTYDTTGHEVNGVSQQQTNAGRIIVFRSAKGIVEVSTLPIVR